jgi:DNA-binding MarR family transcriptional regulator
MSINVREETTADDARLLLEAQALRRAASVFQRALRQSRDPDTPTPAQLSALGTLHREGPLAAGELAQRERLQPQSVTRLIAALVGLGLAERNEDDADRRRAMIAITPAGRRELRREMQRREKRLARALSALTPSERSTLAASVEILVRIAKEAE